MSNVDVLTQLTYVLFALVKKKNRRKRRNRSVWCRKWLMLRDDIGGKDIQSLTFDELVPDDPKNFQNFNKQQMVSYMQLWYI